jgi:putative transposase
MEGQVRRLEVSDAKRLKSLEDENGKLRKLLAEAMLDNAMLKEKILRDCRYLLHDRDTNYSAAFRAINRKQVTSKLCPYLRQVQTSAAVPPMSSIFTSATRRGSP